MEERERVVHEIPEDTFRKVIESEEFIKEYLLKRDELLFQAKLSQGQCFSKYTFATSAIALSASLTLVKLFQPATEKVLLGLSWISFAMAVITSLASILVSLKAIDQQVEQLRGKEPYLNVGACVEFLNTASLILIAIGILAAIIFSCINLDKRW